MARLTSTIENLQVNSLNVASKSPLTLLNEKLLYMRQSLQSIELIFVSNYYHMAF